MVPQVPLARWAPSVRQENRAPLALRVQQGRQAQREQLAQQVQQAREVRLGVRVRLVIRVLRGPLVVKALAALLVRVAA
jgi:hypothetical protein